MSGYVIVNGVERAAASDPGGTPRSLLRIALWNAADGICAICGQATILDGRPSDDNLAEISHIVPGYNGSKTGIQDGNVFNGCRRCNLNADRMVANGDLRPFLSRFERADLIPNTLPKGWRQWKKDSVESIHKNVSDEVCANVFA